jgi:serine/threonine protein kinase/tetratricopeptide (TPR) repeat protein
VTLQESLQRVLGSTFAIERELPGGGMAHLFVALDVALNRRVVVKVLPPERSEGVSAERFRGEIRTVAALQHPNIVGILAAGDVEGLPYYIMPFIDGESLRALLERSGAISPQQTVAILRDVARACAYAHERGIMHRDIKPDNVLLSGGAAMITDFGIAKALSMAQRPPRGGTLTREGYTVGTPMYMAPEQLAGDPDMDFRADFYAIGVMAYEMLAGRVPFGQTTPRALLAAQLSEPPEALESIRPDVPVRLARLVTACLQKEPADRPAEAGVILATLDDPALLSDEHAVGRRATPTVPLHAERRRRRLAAGGLVAIGLALLALIVTLLRPGGESSPKGGSDGASLVVLPFTDQSPDSSGAYLAEGLTSGITGMLASIPTLRVTPSTGAERYRTQRPTPEEIGRELNVATLLVGRVTRSASQLTAEVSLLDAGTGKKLYAKTLSGPLRDLVEMQQIIANEAAAALSRRFGRLSTTSLRSAAGFRNPEAYDLYLQGMYAFRRRGDGLQSALQRFQEAAALDSLAAPVYASLADVYAVMPLYSGMAPDAALGRALPFAERAVTLDSTSAMAWASRGNVYDELWRWADGAADLQRAVAMDSDFALARQWYGENLLLNGDIEGAARELGTAARLEPHSAVVAGLHGLVLVLSGQVDSGITIARRAVDLEPGQAALRLLLGAAYLYAERPFDAVFSLAGALELDPANPQVIGMLGYSYAVLGQTPKARALLTRLLRDAGRPGAQAGIARIHIGLGNPDEALDRLEAAAREHDPMFASEPLLTPIFDPLRQHPRFARLVRGIGLSERVLR